MTRRAAALVLPVVVAAGLAPGPAHADARLAARVVDVTAERVRIVADVPRGAAGKLPPLTVARDGWSLPVSVAPGPPEDAPGGTRTVVVVLDTGVANPRLAAVRDAVDDLVGALPTDVAVGVVAAADEPAVVSAPTADRAAVRTALGDLAPAGRSDLYAGLTRAAGLGGSAGDRRIVVVAAGAEDDRSAASATAAVTAAGHRVDLVRLGTRGEGLAPLRRLVTASGGTVRTVPGDDGLADALTAVGWAVPARVTVSVAVPPELAGTTTTLTVTAGSGAARASTTLPVELPPAPPADPGPAPGPARTLARGLVGVFVFAALLAGLLVVAFGVAGTVPRRRLRQVEQFRSAGGRRPDDRTVPPHGGLSARPARSLGENDRVGRDLERAGMTLRPGEWAAWRAGAAVAGAVLVGIIIGWLGVPLGALLGWVGTTLYRKMREERRGRAFAEQLPDALQLVVGSLRSGFSLAQAIDGVVKDFAAGPLTVEFGRSLAEVRLGSDLDDALERVAQRMGNDDLAWAVMAVRIQRETGGNLAEVLTTTVETLRERDRLRRHVRALSAEGRLSASILVALPFVMAGWMLLVRRDYLSPLWTTSAGLAMVTGAVVLMLIGTIWLARWVKVEV